MATSPNATLEEEYFEQLEQAHYKWNRLAVATKNIRSVNLDHPIWIFDWKDRRAVLNDLKILDSFYQKIQKPKRLHTLPRLLSNVLLATFVREHQKSHSVHRMPKDQLLDSLDRRIMRMTKNRTQTSPLASDLEDLMQAIQNSPCYDWRREKIAYGTSIHVVTKEFLSGIEARHFVHSNGLLLIGAKDALPILQMPLEERLRARRSDAYGEPDFSCNIYNYYQADGRPNHRRIPNRKKRPKTTPGQKPQSNQVDIHNLNIDKPDAFI